MLGGTFGATGIDSTVPTIAALDSAGSRREIGVSPFADSADSSSPDEEERIGMSRVVADPDSDDELPDDEIVDPRVKVETIHESAASPPRSESESDDDMANYIPPLPYGGFKDWEIVSCPLRNISYHVYHQDNRRKKCFTYLKELLSHVYREDLLLLRVEGINVYLRALFHVLDLDIWKTGEYVVDKGLSYRATTWSGSYVTSQAHRSTLHIVGFFVDGNVQEGTALDKDFSSYPVDGCQVTQNWMVITFHILWMKSVQSITKAHVKGHFSNLLEAAVLCFADLLILLFIEFCGSHLMLPRGFYVSAVVLLLLVYIVSAGICVAAGSSFLAVFINIY
ncbi:hypothetical protein Tco_0080396 [Tanacetum coccineum]